MADIDCVFLACYLYIVHRSRLYTLM